MIATDRRVHLSVMTGKLDGFRAINTNTVTNPFCLKMKESDTICGKCYSHRMLNTFRKSCQPSFQRNSELLSEAVLTVLPTINDRVFRFHGHGELINATHLENLYLIAEHNPLTTFSLWTKQSKLVLNHRQRPDNFIVIYSNPQIDRVRDVPKGFDKVFNNVTGEAESNCTGQQCKDCLLCYTKGGTDIIVEHVK